MTRADVIREFQLYTGLPLFGFIVLLGSGTILFLIFAAYYLRSKDGARRTAGSIVKDALIRFRWLIWLVITTDLFLISNHLLARGLAVGVWDADAYFYPYYVLVADAARTGRFVYWNPWSNAGVPIFGDPTLGIFSPLNVIVGFITGGTSSGFIFYWLLMWWLGGFGVFMLAQHLKAPPWGGCVVALGFLFCGAYTGNAEHTPWIIAFSFLPLIVWRLDAALCFRKLRPAVEAGALWGLSALAGYPPLTIITGCFVTLWAIGRWLFGVDPKITDGYESGDSAAKMRERTGVDFIFSALVIVCLVGIIVLSPAYVAFFFEGAGSNARVDPLSREWVTFRNALHPGALASFASPYLTVVKFYDQMNGENRLWPYTDVSSVSIYAGAIISVLAVFALFSRPRQGWRWWLVGLGALSLACAVAHTLPLRGWLYDWFFPMRFFRNAAIFRFYYLFAVSVLALIATRELATAMRSAADSLLRRLWLASVCVAAGALVVFLVFINANPAPGSKKLILFLGSAHAVWIWLGICCIAFFARMLPSRLTLSWVPALLVILAASDAFLTSTLSKQTIMDTRSEYLKRWESLDGKHSTMLELTRVGLVREEVSCFPNPPCQYLNSDQLITKIPVFNSYVTYNDFHRKMVRHPILKKKALTAERIWFSKEVAQLSPTRSNFAAFVKRTETLGEPPLVVHSPEELLSLGAPPREDPLLQLDRDALHDVNADQVARIAKLPAAEKMTVNLLKYLPDEVVFDVQSLADGWLLMTDRWARSWWAEINGKQTRLYGGNFIFRAVQVQAGQNRIRFVYRPFGFPWLVLLSWGTLAIVAISSVYSCLRSRRIW